MGGTILEPAVDLPRGPDAADSPDPAGTTDRVDPAGTTDGADSSEMLARRITAWSLAMFLVARCFVIVVARLPEITPDEPGAWAVGKWLSGTSGTILMGDMPRYPLMPGAMVAPLWWLPVDPTVRYRLGLALLSATTVFAAYLIRRTLLRLGTDHSLAAAAFALVLLIPSTMYAGAFTWAEPTVLLWWAAIFWGVTTFATSPHPRGAMLLTSVIAGTAPFVHGRLSAVPVIWCVVLAVEAVRTSESRRCSRRLLASALLVTLASAVVCFAAHRAVGAALWSGGDPTVPGQGPALLLDTGFWVTLLAEAAGQLLYVILATAGLALAGAAMLTRMVRRPRRRGERTLGFTLAAMLGSNLLISTLYMASFLHASERNPGQLLTAPRWDHLVYGRYNDAAAVVLATLGIVWLGQLASRRDVRRFGLAGVTLGAALGWVVYWRMSGLRLSGEFPTANASGLTTIPFAGSGPSALAWSVYAMAVVGGVAVAAATGRRALLGALGVWLLVAGLVGAGHAVTTQRYGFLVDLAADLGPPSVAGAPFIVPSDTNLERHVRMSVYQAQLGLVDQGWATQLVDRSSRDVASEPGSAGAMLLMEGEHPTGSGWTVVERYGQIAVWRRS